MRRILAVAAVTLAASIAATAHAGGDKPASGIRGYVTYGPTCAVQQQGQDCREPYPGATIKIRHRGEKHAFRRVKSDDHGRFKVALAPGRYVLDPVNGDPYPRAENKRVRVDCGEYKHVRIDYDTGIR